MNLKSSPKNLCILRLSAIGDVCHAAAMVTAIQKQKPDISITWIIGKVEHMLVKSMPNIEFIVYDKSLGSQADKALKRELGDRQFDVLFVMQVAFRAGWLSRLIKAKTKVGFDRKRSKEAHSLFINKRIAPRRNAHVLEGFMGFAETLGVSPLTKPQWTIQLDESDKQWVKNELPERYAVICPAASKAERCWDAKRYAAIADYIKQQNIEPILCGGPADLDKELAAAILANSRHLSMNLVGQTSLLKMLAVLKYAEFVVSPDSGPAHMATTQATPVIGLYAHSNPRRTGPYFSLMNCATVYDDCIQQQYGKTWQQLPWGKRAKGGDLMDKISVQEVKSLIQKIINNVI